MYPPMLFPLCLHQSATFQSTAFLCVCVCVPLRLSLTHFENHRLKQVIATYNKLTSLPESLKHLQNLTALDLSHNRLTELPSYLHTLKSLSFFRVMHNPIKGVPRDFITQGDTQLLSFLKEQLGGYSSVYRSKLMFVGEGNVGKTCLLNSILKKPKKSTKLFGRKEDEEDTQNTSEGIDIREWSCKTPLLKPDEKIEFSMCDFAGQEVYHYTHQFFLTHRAIYLIVFNIAESVEWKKVDDWLEERAKIEHWLHTVKSKLSQPAPVLLVGTHVDDKRCTQEQIDTVLAVLKKKYASRFDNIVGYYTVSTKAAKGIEELKQAIINTALQCSYMPEDIPKPYLRLETAIINLRNSKDPAIPFSEFATLALECGLEESSITAAATYFHDLGVVGYFQDIDKDFIITNPHWLTSMVSTLLTMKQEVAKKGIVSRSMLKTIWKPPMYPEYLHNFMLALLERFEVIYSLQAEGQLLIPCMLDSVPDPEMIQKEWPSDKDYHSGVDGPKKQLGRFYHFDFLPIGFFSRIIVRFLNGVDWKPEEYWKNGIILSKETEKVLLKLIPEKHHFRMYVRGADPASKIVALVDNVGTLIQDCFEVPVRMFIPCTHCIQEGIEDPIVFNQRECETALVKGKGNVFCPRRLISVSVHDIAPDVSMATFRGCQIAYSEVKILEEIGQGAFASVYKAHWRGEIVAVKRLEIKPVMVGDLECRGDRDLLEQRKQQERILEVYTEFRQEVSLLSSLKHPNVVEMKGIVLEPFCIVMEYMGFGNLYDFVHNLENPIDWPTRLRIASGIASAINFLHLDYRMIHRDLKSPNILLTKEKTANGELITAKVSDFGLSRKLLLSPELQNRVVDNPIWLAPEIISKQKYTEKADVYSFGIIIWELLARKVPFAEMEFLWEIQESIVEGKRPEIPPCPVLYRELIDGCWAGDPEMRPNFDTILQKLEMVTSFIQEHPDDHSTIATPVVAVAEKEEPKLEVDEVPSSPKASPKSKDSAKALTKSPSSTSRRAARHSKVSLAEGTEEFATFVSNLKRQRSMSTPPPINPDLLEADLEKKDKEKKKKKSSRLREVEESGSFRERRKSSKNSSDESHSPLIKRQTSKIPSLQLPHQTADSVKQDEIILQRVHDSSSPATSQEIQPITSSEASISTGSTISSEASEVKDLTLKLSDITTESALESLKALESVSSASSLPASSQLSSENTVLTTGSSSSPKTSTAHTSSSLSLVSTTSVPSLPMVAAPTDYPFPLMKATSSSSARKSPKGISSGFASMRERSSGSSSGNKVPATSIDDINSHKEKGHNVATIGSERFGELMKLFQHKWRSSTSSK
eukprot:TRINITY_DN4636_c0_g2_i1.p1 TRINITY_DN4636_c0_g2~~TRINITY_DN4636_c0_g2_i1.p1  ORF type:complete len:1322 (+),score=264.84 TRINITY_DN4636_c0_g2_i1:1203-5168(+)